jgi:integrase
MSVYRHKPSGRWMFEFDRYMPGHGRTRKRRLLPAGWTRAQAEAYDRKEGAALSAIAEGISKPRRFIDEAVTRYTGERLPRLKSGANIAGELEQMRDWWTGRAIEDLPEVATEYAEDQEGALAPATIKNRIAYLRSACRYGWKRYKLCEHDPGARVVVPEVNNERQVYVTRGEMLQLARACEHWETRALIRIAFYSGMRLGEILAAEVEAGCFILPDSKNGDPVRMPVHRKVRNLVDYVWPTRFIVGYHFRAARAAAGLDHLHFHDLRHSTASDLLSQGQSLAIVGKVLRHRSAASTQRYAHLYDDVLAGIIDSIGTVKKSPNATQGKRPAEGAFLEVEARSGVEPPFTDLQSGGAHGAQPVSEVKRKRA